ncbi:MAG: hypothetical protein AB7L13_01705 [Acidimicrobiia bacterium]
MIKPTTNHQSIIAILIGLKAPAQNVPLGIESPRDAASGLATGFIDGTSNTVAFAD